MVRYRLQRCCSRSQSGETVSKGPYRFSQGRAGFDFFGEKKSSKGSNTNVGRRRFVNGCRCDIYRERVCVVNRRGWQLGKIKLRDEIEREKNAGDSELFATRN